MDSHPLDLCSTVARFRPDFARAVFYHNSRAKYFVTSHLRMDLRSRAIRNHPGRPIVKIALLVIVVLIAYPVLRNPLSVLLIYGYELSRNNSFA
jgi:hypothetical protein